MINLPEPGSPSGMEISDLYSEDFKLLLIQPPGKFPEQSPAQGKRSHLLFPITSPSSQNLTNSPSLTC